MGEPSLGMPRITFNRPTIEGNELMFVREAVQLGHTSSSGPFAKRATDLLRDHQGAADVLLTTSCTAALEMGGLLLDIQPGDVVIVPSFTFVTTALAFVRAGARLRFADIEDETLGIDPKSVADLMDERVRAVVAVHYAGIGCDVDALEAVLANYPYAELVEDNAHGLFGSYRGEPLGTFGRFATLSFHETKNFVCGEGGALLINDPSDLDRAHVVYDKGTDRRAFFMGQVDKYSWRDTGSSFGLSDILAAYLLAQLEQKEQILAKRRTVYERYDSLLRPIASDLGIRTPVIPPDRECAWHMYYILLPDATSRDQVLKAMTAQEIYPTFHYVPLHSSEGGRRFADEVTDCPVTDNVSARLLRLPFHNTLSAEDQERVAVALIKAMS